MHAIFFFYVEAAVAPMFPKLRPHDVVVVANKTAATLIS